MKIALEVANKHMEESSQTYAKDQDKRATFHPF
jgi:hypothetical protein